MPLILQYQRTPINNRPHKKAKAKKRSKKYSAKKAVYVVYYTVSIVHWKPPTLRCSKVYTQPRNLSRIFLCGIFCLHATIRGVKLMDFFAAYPLLCYTTLTKPHNRMPTHSANFFWRPFLYAIRIKTALGRQRA